ncbi:GNAT family N-acetyltransferase [Streptomyces collinus]|uniref:GNAT family N-acetyltransferase n=1 Tax=Streptomyces collinus TaxID=42684 RepID=UPI0036BF1D5D
MNFIVREASGRDVPEMGRIFFESFNDFNRSVGLSPEWPSMEFACNAVQGFVDHPGYKAFVAVNAEGRVVGSNFLECHDFVAAPGPISVDSGRQNRGVGRLLMQAVIDCAQEMGKTSIQGVQLASNTKSYALYADMGFIPREQLVALVGFPSGIHNEFSKFEARPMMEQDAPHCIDLFHAQNGYSRARDISLAAQRISPWADPFVVEDGSGEIVGYTTGLSLLGHMSCTSEESMRALYVKASAQISDINGNPPLIHIPARLYPETVQWAIQRGVKVLRLETLISIGEFNYPKSGVYCPGMAY